MIKKGPFWPKAEMDYLILFLSVNVKLDLAKLTTLN